MLEIEPVAIEQYKKAGDDWIIIKEDLGDIAKRLHELDSRLHIRFNPVQEFYAIFARENNKEYLVGTYKSLDARMVTRMEQILSSGYDFKDEVKKQDDAADKAAEQKYDQIMGENAERLAFALRKDLGLNKDTIFVPGS